MSPPAEKARSPAPRMTTRVIAGSRAHSLSLAASAWTMPCVTALSACGRFSVITPAAPHRSNRMSCSALKARPSIPQQVAADDHPHHLVGALENLMDAHVAQHALDRMIAQVTVAAVELQATFERLEASVRGEPLRISGKARGAFLAIADGEGRAPLHQARGFELRR